MATPSIILECLLQDIYEAEQVAEVGGLSEEFSNKLKANILDSEYFQEGKRQKGIILDGEEGLDAYRVLGTGSDGDANYILVDPPLRETYARGEIYSCNLVVHPQTLPIIMTTDAFDNTNNCGELRIQTILGTPLYASAGPIFGNQISVADDFITNGSFVKTYINDTNIYEMGTTTSNKIKTGCFLKMDPCNPDTLFKCLEVIVDENDPNLKYAALSPRPQPALIGVVDGDILGYVPPLTGGETDNNTDALITKPKQFLTTLDADGSVGQHSHDVNDHTHIIESHTHDLDNFNYTLKFKDMTIIILDNDKITLGGQEYSILSIVYDQLIAPPYSGTMTVNEPLKAVLYDEEPIRYPYVYGDYQLALYRNQGIAYLPPIQSISPDVHQVRIHATAPGEALPSATLEYNFLFAPSDVQASIIMTQGATRTKKVGVGFYYLLPGYIWEMGVTGIKNHWDTQTIQDTAEFSQPDFPGSDSV